MVVWTQNRKMKKSGASGVAFYNFGIPAFRSETGLATCPQAGACAAGCYAKSGAYLWPAVRAAYEARLAFTQAPDFVERMGHEVDKVIRKHEKKGERVVFRIHDSGDFYSAAYLEAWRAIITAAKARHGSNAHFYAYTKSVALFKSVPPIQGLRLLFSLGGKQDALIDLRHDAHSRVFESEQGLEHAGYRNASDDDSVAARAESGVKIGLVYHGAKSFGNTQWGKQ
jgi:hypothetical protein